MRILRGFLFFLGFSTYRQLAAQEIGPAPNKDIEKKLLRFENIFAHQAPRDLFLFEFGLVKTANFAERDWIHGLGASFRLDIQNEKDTLYSQFYLKGIADDATTKEAIDEDRHSLWGSGHIELGAYSPIQLDSSTFLGERFFTNLKRADLGLVLRLEGYENTPTSVEKSLSLEILPTFRAKTSRLLAEIGFGLGAFHQELDDDLPR